MAKDPGYVRLRGDVTMVGDVKGKSGWSISGLAVLAFPENERQAAFVREKLQAGILEPSSKAEFEEASEGDGDLSAVPGGSKFHQEGDLRAKAAEVQEKIQKRRAKASKDDDDDDDKPAAQQGPQTGGGN